MLDVSTLAALWGIFSRQLRYGAGQKGNGVHYRVDWAVVTYAEVVRLTSRRRIRSWLDGIRQD